LQEVVAAVRCSRVEGEVGKKYDYIGYHTCTGSNLAFGGPQGCRYACIGFGDCAQSCPFDAITMAEGFPVVDYNACVGCGTCVRTCPKKIIELLPRAARVWVPCSTKDPGKQVKEVCQAGCISCRMCVKVCPAKAVNLEDNVVVIDHDKCIAYGPGCDEVCVEKCPRKIFRHYRPQEAEKEQIPAAG
jgi:electron transport complex protein RnfB